MREILRQATPWATATAGGLGTAWLAHKLAPKKYKNFLGALGLLGGGAAGYYLGKKLSDTLQDSNASESTGGGPGEAVADTPTDTASTAEKIYENTTVDTERKEDPTVFATDFTAEELADMRAKGVDPIVEQATADVLERISAQYPADVSGQRANMLGMIRGVEASLGGSETAQKALVTAPVFWPWAATDVALDRAGVAGDSGLVRMGLGSGASWLVGKGVGALLKAIPKSTAVLSPLAYASNLLNQGAGYSAAVINTTENIKKALSGDAYSEDAAQIRKDLGPGASPLVTLAYALGKNTIRSGMQALGTARTLSGDPLSGAILGASLPIDHPIALGREYGRFLNNSNRHRAQENANVQHFLGQHFKNGVGTGLLKSFSSGYWEPEQDKEFVRMEQARNNEAKRINNSISFITKLLRKQNPELAKRVDAGDINAIRAFNRLRASRL